MGAQPIRVGLVGGNADRGWARDAHVPALAALPRFRVAGVSARDQAGADRAAAALGADRAFGDSFALARSPDIDLVSVTVKVPEHLPIVLAALEAGKHVYCEWPLGRTVEEAETMAAAAAWAPGQVIVGLQGLGAPAVRQAEAIIASSRLGRLLSARVVSPTGGWGVAAPAHYAYLNDPRNGATLSTIAGGHTLALVERLLGAYRHIQAQETILHPQVVVHGEDRTVRRTCADHLSVIGRHASGCVSSVEVVGGRPNTPFLFELFGAEGDLRIFGHCPGGYQTGVLTLETSVEAPPPPPSVREGLTGPPANVAELYDRLALAIDTGRAAEPGFATAVGLSRLLRQISDAAASPPA